MLHLAKDILDKLRELKVDLRSNPAYFIGGGSILFREFLEKSPLVAKAYFLESPNANALGYQVMAETQQAISREEKLLYDNEKRMANIDLHFNSV